MGLGKIKIRTKIVIPTILVLVISNLISTFTSAYQMNDMAKENAKTALHQMSDSIFLNLRTAMNTGDSAVIADAEEKSRTNIAGLKNLTVAKSQKLIELYSPTSKFTEDVSILKVFDSKKESLIEVEENGAHDLRVIRPMIATNECLACHVNQSKGEVIGVLDLTFSLLDSDEIIDSTVTSLIIQALVVLVFITLFMTWLIRKATKPIEIFQQGLEMFFKYINKEEKKVNHIDTYSKDEIGDLIESVNKNIDATVTGVKLDEKVILEAREVCKEAAHGVYDVSIKSEAHSPEINELKKTINNLISAVGYNISRVEKILCEYDSDDYTARINSKGNTTGRMKEVFDKIDSLGNTLQSVSKESLDNGIELQDDAISLETSVGKITSFTHQQLNALQKSSNELSEVTSNLRQNTNDINKMSDYAKKVTSSVNEGQNLAVKTANEMDEIAEEVRAINEAISIIDQISFQTNILSLNAAVEAATAGEAGKGFAVVAQEVRNLASRSAEAAKEIKVLVESAIVKTNEGKEISSEMMEGYSTLNKDISSTINLIEDVTKVSLEQQKSIESINDEVSILEQNTLETTNMLEESTKIAQKTSSLAQRILEDAKSKKI